MRSLATDSQKYLKFWPFEYPKFQIFLAAVSDQLSAVSLEVFSWTHPAPLRRTSYLREEFSDSRCYRVASNLSTPSQKTEGPGLKSPEAEPGPGQEGGGMAAALEFGLLTSV
jgi:hypothetical protein